MKRTIVAALAVISLLGAACSGSDDSTEAKNDAVSGGTSTTVEIKAFEFVPGDITVSAGDEVRWTNDDDILHTITSGIGQEQGVPGVSENTDAEPDGLFDQEMDGLEAEFSFTFEKAGTYDYYCAIHPGMTGTVTVE